MVVDLEETCLFVKFRDMSWYNGEEEGGQRNISQYMFYANARMPRDISWCCLRVTLTINRSVRIFFFRTIYSNHLRICNKGTSVVACFVKIFHLFALIAQYRVVVSHTSIMYVCLRLPIN